jgi:hypothetical protein
MLEKGQQVQLMAKIYAKASSVIVWLGESTAKTEHALEIIRVAAADVSNGLSANLSKDDPPDCNPTENNAVLILLQNPWFQRIWVS